MLLSFIFFSMPSANGQTIITMGSELGISQSSAALTPGEHSGTNHSNALFVDISSFPIALSKWQLKPVFSLSSNAIEDVSMGAQSHTQVIYDHRILSLGAQLSHPIFAAILPFPLEGYSALAYGGGLSKITSIRKGAGAFTESHLNGADVRYWAVKLGVRIPLQTKVSINAGLNRSFFAVNQTGLTGSVAQQRQTTRNTTLNLTKSSDEIPETLPSTHTQQLWSLVLGLNFEF
jgi:hypothetical protein